MTSDYRLYQEPLRVMGLLLPGGVEPSATRPHHGQPAPGARGLLWKYRKMGIQVRWEFGRMFGLNQLKAPQDEENWGAPKPALGTGTNTGWLPLLSDPAQPSRAFHLSGYRQLLANSPSCDTHAPPESHQPSFHAPLGDMGLTRSPPGCVLQGAGLPGESKPNTRVRTLLRSTENPQGRGTRGERPSGALRSTKPRAQRG